MDKIEITEDALKNAGIKGEKEAAKALSVLAKTDVEVNTTNVRLVDAGVAASQVDVIKEHPIVAYTQALTGVSGVSLLSLQRQDALNLVDLFNNRPAGTTIVMQELDRSTIRETLNILGNAYVTELAKVMGNTILLSVPHLVTKDKIKDVVEMAKTAEGQKTVLFETDLAVSDVDFKVTLYFFFLTGDVVYGE